MLIMNESINQSISQNMKRASSNEYTSDKTFTLAVEYIF